MKTDDIANAHRADWDALARMDPLYAIAGVRDKRFGGWDAESFLASGSNEADLLCEALTRFGIPPQTAVILEVGCGAGRVGGHVARRVARYVGVDVSQTMLQLAAKFNAEISNCTWQLTSGADLSDLPSSHFDAVFSHLVLQHCPSRFIIRALITDMLRVVRPGGLVVFQLPASMPLARRLQPRRRLYRALRALGLPDEMLYARLKLHPIRMMWLRRSAVEAIIAATGGSVIEVCDGWLGAGGSAAGETNLSYVIRRNSGEPARKPARIGSTARSGSASRNLSSRLSWILLGIRRSPTFATRTSSQTAAPAGRRGPTASDRGDHG